jgi:hypothetical protein
MNIAVIGSRDFPQLDSVAAYVRGLPSGTIVISGGARGVDRVAASAARAAGHTVREFRPDWDRHGKSAGFKRNAQIVEASDRLVAFWDGKSRGTADTIEKARQADLHITVIRPDGSTYRPEPLEDDSFDDTDPQDGATREEYEAARESDDATDYALPVSDREGLPKVKLLTANIRWICAPKPKTRETKSGRTLDYFTQALFTTRGNRIILTYDAGTRPMKDGPGRGILAEIFGREIEKQTNADKTVTSIIFGAEVFTRGVQPAKATTSTSPAASHGKPSRAGSERAEQLTTLRAEYSRITRSLEFDDHDKTEKSLRLEEIALRIHALEQSPTSSPVRDTNEANELRALIRSQNADRFSSTSDEVDLEVTDEDPAADILDADEDGAEITRATEPWADASAPIGAYIDEDCWTCPCRLGASCSRAAQACLLAA